MLTIRKQLSIADADLKMDGETGRFAGYASRFGGVDTAGDTILAGAFAYSLRKFGKPRMFFNHQWDLPIGKFTNVQEDESGLYVEGEFTPGLGRAQDVRSAMKHGTIDSMSIGGFVKEADTEKSSVGEGRIIKHFTKLIDISPVVFPADARAQIDMSTVKRDRTLTKAGVQDIVAGLDDLQLAISLHIAMHGDGTAPVAGDMEDSPGEVAAHKAILDAMQSAAQQIGGDGGMGGGMSPMGMSAMSSEREIERFLRDAGVSRSEATGIVARMKAILGRGEPEPNHELAALHARLARLLPQT